jgi:copper transporter 1
MLFTWDTTDLCIVFPSWHISGTGSLIFSLLAIILLTAGYEAIREVSRRYEAYSKSVMEGPRGELISPTLQGLGQGWARWPYFLAQDAGDQSTRRSVED